MSENVTETARSEPAEGQFVDPSTSSGTDETRPEPVEGQASEPSTSSGTDETRPELDEAQGSERGRRKVREGYVVSDKMEKTVVVAVEDRVKHRLYGKVLRQTVRLKAHDERGEAGLGDRVRIMETRPLSATKRWRLVTIVEKAK
jgi:small subunit ribosomal protein S17